MLTTGNYDSGNDNNNNGNNDTDTDNKNELKLMIKTTITRRITHLKIVLICRTR